MELKEFRRAIKDYKLDLEEVDIDNIFNSFDVNGDGVLQLEEFMDMILGKLEGNRSAAVDEAFMKLSDGRGTPVPYNKIRDTFDPRRHPDVCNGRKTEDEAITDFLEIFEMHHNTFNNYEK